MTGVIGTHTHRYDRYSHRSSRTASASSDEIDSAVSSTNMSRQHSRAAILGTHTRLQSSRVPATVTRLIDIGT